MHVDLQPLVLAGAGVLVALTPVAVAYLTLQVRLLGLRADAIERAAVEDRAILKASLVSVRAAVVSTAADTQAVVKDVGGKVP
jgi:hypothetical protein